MTPPDELLDLVDKNDEIIGTIERSKANSQKGLIHREVGLLLLTGDGKVLVQKRTKTKKTFPGEWILSVAGHVPSGQIPDLIAHTELQEELGFDTKLVLIDKELMDYPTETNFAYIYIGRIPQNMTFKLDPNETELVEAINEQDYQMKIQEGEIFQSGSLHFLKKLWSGAYDKYLAQI